MFKLQGVMDSLGTPAFLPVEVADQAYTDMDFALSLSLDKKGIEPHFNQNGFHNLESFCPANQCSDAAFEESYRALFLSDATSTSWQKAWSSPIYCHTYFKKLSSASIPLGDGLHHFASKFFVLKQSAYSALGEDLANLNKLKEPVHEVLTLLLSKIEGLCALPEVTAHTDLNNCQSFNLGKIPSQMSGICDSTFNAQLSLPATLKLVPKCKTTL
ncbi:hypothetical protein BDP27DRAFT_1360045 [Rhodocollybia butyracea]|uniref:Uncharacterized protein n=1 Tax=Rhodocollybia butyracea TaxID=206335 RepID=A0A9P5Q327_9AGAR|nr:hypothetical protein BDP27DRAFT_1360045 [Rhodocollybia butyracea]